MYELTVEKVIRTTLDQAWEGLTDPRKSARYFWGVEMESDFRVGSPVVWRGVWEGKPFEDRGTITRNDRNSTFQYRYWSAFTGLPDDPANYQLVTYRFAEDPGGVRVSIRQENIATPEAREHSEKNWTTILEQLGASLETGGEVGRPGQG